ncbi:MAG: 3'-5' exonuclease [Opitutales bacterium]|nr:3'-5' exonuclease [Opitutales bacterium]
MDFEPYRSTRWVVFDTETTGTMPTRDRIVSIGAMAIEDMEINPNDAFECLVRVPFNSSSVVIHGITKDETQREGIEEAEAIEQFNDYLGDAYLVGHHVAFDIIVVNHALRRTGLPILENPAIDVMKLVMRLEEQKLVQPRENPNDFSLDGLLDHFDIPKAGRHTAMGDSFATGMLWMQLLRFCKKAETDILESVMETDIGLGE